MILIVSLIILVYLILNLMKIGAFSKLSMNTIKSNFGLFNISKKNYHPVRELMKKNVPRFFQDPNEVGEELIRIISMHDKITDPSIIKLGSTWEEIGLDSLDMVECILHIENYWGYDFGAADWEQFLTINDVAQFISRDFFAVRH